MRLAWFDWQEARCDCIYILHEVFADDQPLLLQLQGRLEYSTSETYIHCMPLGLYLVVLA